MTKFSITGSENYAARIVTAHTLVELPGLDNLRGLPVDGFMALVQKDTPIGSTLAVFPAGAALSETFASAHDLYRHTERNQTPGAVGYLEDNGRVKAIRLRGHMSSALALPIDGPEGTLFDTIDGVVVSQKWVNPNYREQKVGQKKVRVCVNLPEHFDTANYWRNSHLIAPDTHVTVTQKLHGTSVRIGNIPVEQPQRWWERLLRRPVRSEYKPVIGSRRVVKYAGEVREGQHFYGEDGDIWTTAGLPIAELLPKDVIVYAEIVGWIGDKPIQPNYTYEQAPGTFKVYVYRVVVSGFDLGWTAVQQFCEQRGLTVVPTLWQGPHSAFDADAWLDDKYAQVFPQAVPLSDPKSVDEGVCVRAEGITPVVLKAKSPIFLGHESALLDAGADDTEEDQA